MIACCVPLTLATFLGYWFMKSLDIGLTVATLPVMVLEMGAGYFRFHSQGYTLMTDGTLDSQASGKTPYEVVSPYTKPSHLASLHYCQSADVLTLVCPSIAPQELRRSGAVSWAFTTISFAAPIASPGSVAVAASSVSTPAAVVETKWDYYYVVTAIAADGIGESAASSSARWRETPDSDSARSSNSP